MTKPKKERIMRQLLSTPVKMVTKTTLLQMIKVGPVMNPACALVQNIPRLQRRMTTIFRLPTNVISISSRNAFISLATVFCISIIIRQTSFALSGLRWKNTLCTFDKKAALCTIQKLFRLKNLDECSIALTSANT